MLSHFLSVCVNALSQLVHVTANTLAQLFHHFSINLIYIFIQRKFYLIFRASQRLLQQKRQLFALRCKQAHPKTNTFRLKFIHPAEDVFGYVCVCVWTQYLLRSPFASAKIRLHCYCCCCALVLLRLIFHCCCTEFIFHLRKCSRHEAFVHFGHNWCRVACARFVWCVYVRARWSTNAIGVAITLSHLWHCSLFWTNAKNPLRIDMLAALMFHSHIYIHLYARSPRTLSLCSRTQLHTHTPYHI